MIETQRELAEAYSWCSAAKGIANRQDMQQEMWKTAGLKVAALSDLSASRIRCRVKKSPRKQTRQNLHSLIFKSYSQSFGHVFMKANALADINNSVNSIRIDLQQVIEQYTNVKCTDYVMYYGISIFGNSPIYFFTFSRHCYIFVFLRICYSSLCIIW